MKKRDDRSRSRDSRSVSQRRPRRDSRSNDSRNDRMTGMSTLPETYYNSKISKNKGSTNN